MYLNRDYRKEVYEIAINSGNDEKVIDFEAPGDEWTKIKIEMCISTAREIRKFIALTSSKAFNS